MNTSLTGHDDSNKDNGFHSAKEDDLKEETMASGEKPLKLFVGDLEINIDKFCEKTSSFDESLYEHSLVPPFLHEECM